MNAKEFKKRSLKREASREKRLEIVAAVKGGMDLIQAAAQHNVTVAAAGKAVAWGKHVEAHQRIRVDVAEKVQDARHYSAQELEPTLQKIEDPYKKFKAMHEVLVGTGDLKPDVGGVFIANLVQSCPVDWKQKIIPATAEAEATNG